MTVCIRSPLSRIGRRQVSVIFVVVLVVLAVAVPVTLYWALQRNAEHERWDLEVRYAQQFWSHTDYAAGLVNGTVAHWNNDTAGFAVNELAHADTALYDIRILDTSHANQLSKISYAIETLRTDSYIATLNQSARSTLANELWSLSMKISHAYWNFVNYTSDSPGVGPPFFYSGPAPPDEHLIQDAVNISLSFQRK